MVGSYDDSDDLFERSDRDPESGSGSAQPEGGDEGRDRRSGQALVMKRAVPELPDWRTMEGMSKGPESLTKALEEERAAENAYYDARIRRP